MKNIPQNPEAEVSLIGGMLSSHDVLEECLKSLSVSHFYQRRLKLIFQTISQMASKSLPVDPGTVFKEMITNDAVQDADLNHFLFKIARSFPPPAYVRHFIDELKKKHRLRGLLELASEVSLEAEGQEDVDAYCDKIERKFYDLAEDRQDDNLLAAAHSSVMETIGKIKSGEGIGAIKTGVHAIDNILQGVLPGMMDVYAAEAGCGKTSLIEMIIERFVNEDRPILVFQRDMTPQGFYFRLACRMAGVTVSALRNHGHKMLREVDSVEKWADKLSKSHLKLYSPDGCTASDVRTIARREHRRSKIELVIVDHMRTLRHTKTNSWDGLEENSGYIRQSTNETGVPHIVLTHINRTGAKSDRPTISDIKGGDQLKDDSDNCCVMWAPEGRPTMESRISTWKVNFAFDKTRWDWNSVETMNYNGPKMKFEKIIEVKQ